MAGGSRGHGGAVFHRGSAVCDRWQAAHLPGLSRHRDARVTISENGGEGTKILNLLNIFTVLAVLARFKSVFWAIARRRPADDIDPLPLSSRFWTVAAR